MKLLILSGFLLLSFISVQAQKWSGSTPGDIYYTSGNVGIGTPNPNARLHLFNTSSDGMMIQSDGWPQIDMISNSNDFRSKITINTTTGDLQFRVGQGATGTDGSSDSKLLISQTGNVGIGTDAPKYPLTVKGIINSEANGDYYGAWFGGESRTNKPSVNVGAWWNNKGSIYWDSNKMFFRTQVSSTESYEANLVLNRGSVGIGTANPDAKLAVKGDIHAEEVKVDLNVPGPDYVFDEDYDLPSLEELQNYIRENRHLPEVPSAKEMEANGIDLGEMNLLLLKKVEELTLHLIEHQKIMNDQYEKIETLESVLNELIKTY